MLSNLLPDKSVFAWDTRHNSFFCPSKNQLCKKKWSNHGHETGASRCCCIAPLITLRFHLLYHVDEYSLRAGMMLGQKRHHKTVPFSNTDQISYTSYEYKCVTISGQKNLHRKGKNETVAWVSSAPVAAFKVSRSEHHTFTGHANRINF